MALIIDTDLSGEGLVTFSPANLTSGILRVTTYGRETTWYGSSFPRRLARMGYYAFGYQFADPNGGTDDWFFFPNWIDSETMLFWPNGQPNGVFCERMKWDIPAPGLAHIWVFS